MKSIHYKLKVNSLIRTYGKTKEKNSLLDTMTFLLSLLLLFLNQLVSDITVGIKKGNYLSKIQNYLDSASFLSLPTFSLFNHFPAEINLKSP